MAGDLPMGEMLFPRQSEYQTLSLHLDGKYFSGNNVSANIEKTLPV
jgi:hypothetical protein